jgi:hypothetical protein
MGAMQTIPKAAMRSEESTVTPFLNDQAQGPRLIRGVYNGVPTLLKFRMGQDMACYSARRSKMACRKHLDGLDQHASRNS